MTKLLSIVAVPFVFAVASFACSAADPGSPIGTQRHTGAGTGTGAGGGNGAGGGTGGGASGGGGGGGGVFDADGSAPPPPITYDSGTSPPLMQDAGTTAPDSSTTTSKPGSCGNPICGDDGQGDCGCFAHDSNGDRIEIGCDGTNCACFTNGQQTTDAVPDNGTCGATASEQAEFALDCACN